MDRGIKLGRVFGIEISIDYSWFLIFLLLTWNLATMFGRLHSDWTAVLNWTLGFSASLLFFVSVLAHELAHSLVSIANGLSVRRITLFLFGGVSNIQKHPPSPKAEFMITIVGPATSFVIGIVLLFITGAFLPAQINTISTLEEYQMLMEGLGAVPTMLLWLGMINITLGVFNLIPGFPLDGGRILRSLLWQLSDDLTKATRWASMVGQGVAWLFIFTGVAMVFGVQVPFFGTGFASGIWLAFIGWFLNNASRASYHQVLIDDVLEDVTVRQVARLDPQMVRAESTIEALVHEHIMQSDDQAFPVMDGENQFVGMVTLDDVRKVERTTWGSRRVREIMTHRENLVTVMPDDDAANALRKLGINNVRQLPVMDQGDFVGLFRRADIIRWMKLETDLQSI